MFHFDPVWRPPDTGISRQPAPAVLVHHQAAQHVLHPGCHGTSLVYVRHDTCRLLDPSRIRGEDLLRCLHLCIYDGFHKLRGKLN